MKQTASLQLIDQQLLIKGDLTFDSVSHLIQEGIHYLKSLPHLVIDLSQVNNSNSAGLVVLIEWMRYAHQHNKKISFQNIPKKLLDIINLCDLIETFKKG